MTFFPVSEARLAQAQSDPVPESGREQEFPGEECPPARAWTLGQRQPCRGGGGGEGGGEQRLVNKGQVRTSISHRITFPALKGPVKHGRKLTCQGDRWAAIVAASRGPASPPPLGSHLHGAPACQRLDS